MKLYNSLTRAIEAFTPFEEGTAKMYSCGPTVYNNLHIGNLSAFIYADLLRRTLKASGYEVKAVMNITDVDDKTIRDSKQDYPAENPMAALKLLTRKYENVFRRDIDRIGIETGAITFIRATETIQEMIQLTQSLIYKGFAYPSEDGIYFNIKKYEEAGFIYGQLQYIDRTHKQARVSNDEYDKDSASDFALWKAAEENEPSWDAQFDLNGETIAMPGRPGWHIECSAMSEKLLGLPFDIHTGGIDLKFPHHENEIAQSCAATGSKTFARIFVHNNHILINGKKMSKSLGNFYTLRDIEEKGHNPMAFRMLVLSSHYRSESNFSWEILEAAQNRLNNWQAAADLRWQREAAVSEVGNDLLVALQDDLDTPRAIATVDALFSHFETNTNAPSLKFLENIRDWLGIDLFMPDITEEQKELIHKREQARQAKDWDRSDKLRDLLKKQGIEVRDTALGAIWSRG